MKTIFLIPPSEWKEKKSDFFWEELSFDFEKPFKIAISATEKDLKCKEKRFEEAIFLNKNIWKNGTLEAIKRYNWVMFKNIDFENMWEKWQKYFLENFLILSWFYWILKANDKISNYKLPVSTKWIYDFWWDKIFEKIISEKPDFIVNFLPKDYEKLLNLKKNKEILKEKNIKFINVNFIKKDWKKISHWVKIIKWKFIKDICLKNNFDFEKFTWKIDEKMEIIDVNIL